MSSSGGSGSNHRNNTYQEYLKIAITSIITASLCTFYFNKNPKDIKFQNSNFQATGCQFILGTRELRSTKNKKTRQKFENITIPEVTVTTTTTTTPKPTITTTQKTTTTQEPQNLQKPSKTPKFTCPKLTSLRQVPFSCRSKKPKYPTVYDSSFIGLYPPRSPGPSEQTHAFREVIAAAIESKKSVTLSSFTTHFTDKESKQSEVPIGARINLEKLCELVTIKEQKQKLDTVIMIGREDYRWKNYAKIYTNFGPETRYETNTGNNWISRMSKCHYPRNKDQDFRQTLMELGVAYENVTCKLIGLASAHELIYGNTLGLIDAGGTYLRRKPVLADSRPPNPNTYDVQNKWRVNYDLVKDIQLATEHPVFIKSLAEEFKNEIFGENSDFIGVHWRFNPGDIFSSDFFKSNGSDHFINKERGARVIGISEYLIKLIHRCMNDPKFLLDKLIDHIEKQIPEIERKKTIFITSPVQIADTIASVGRNYRGYNFYTTKDTHEFLSKYRKKCETVDKIYGDILSTMEKEILIGSFCYYRMRPSNWSFNVQAHRWAKKEEISGFKYDSVIYDIFLSDDCDKRCLNSNSNVG